MTEGSVTADRPRLEELFERHRHELRVHCYRMMGSFTEAEDLVQETFLRALRGYEGFEGRASARAWLYRIATNACLDALRRRKRRRMLPFDVMAPVGANGSIPQAGDQLWLEPFPDQLIETLEDPAEGAVRRETLELAFIAAIQHLPPRQRAVFLCRDVLGWTTRGTALVCDMAETAVKSALQRARATMRERLPRDREGWSPTDVTNEERAVLDAYIDAHERGDTEALARTLRSDLRIAYPQIPLWAETRDAFIGASAEFAPPGELRFVPTSANLQPAVAIYLRPPGEAEFQLTALELVRIENGQIFEIVDFDLPHLHEPMGLASTLPA